MKTLALLRHAKSDWDDAGLGDATVDTQSGMARFPSIADWVRTDIKGWTLAEAIDDVQYAELQAAAQSELQRFAAADGAVSFDSPAHIVTVVKR